MVGWFKVYSDILEDPRLMGEDWRLAAYVRLLAMVNRSETMDGILRLPYRALGVAMGRSRGDVALKRLRLLVKDELSCAALYADYVLIILPKYLEKYGNAAPEKCSTKTKTKTTTATPTGVEAREPPKLEGFIRMLKGEIPTGLDGQTWPSSAAWFEHHREILIGEAQAKTGEESGTKFNGAFRSLMMRYWKTKHPKGRATNGGTHGHKPGTLDAALQNQLDAIDREERENAARDEATSQLSLSSGSES